MRDWFELKEKKTSAAKKRGKSRIKLTDCEAELELEKKKAEKKVN